MTYDPIEQLESAVEALRSGHDPEVVAGELPAALRPLVQAGAELHAAGRPPEGSPRPGFVLALEEQLRTDLRLQASAVERASWAEQASAGAVGPIDTNHSASISLRPRVAIVATVLLLVAWGLGGPRFGGRSIAQPLTPSEIPGLPIGSQAPRPAGPAADGRNSAAESETSDSTGAERPAASGRGACADCFRWDQIAAARRQALRGEKAGRSSGEAIPVAGRDPAGRQREPDPGRAGSAEAGAIEAGQAGGAAAATPPADGQAPGGGSSSGSNERRGSDPGGPAAATPEPSPVPGEGAPPTPTPDCWTCNSP